jgi:hypothetical protein
VNKVYVGLPQSGKTTRLIDEYRKLVVGGARTENILILVLSLPQGRKWRGALDLPVTGPIQVLTFWGFVQRELLRFWRLALPRLGDGEAVIQPVFLNAESAHYLMTVLVDEARDAGGFTDMVATSSRIALQILNNLNQAAIHGLTMEDATGRLLAAGSGDTRKMTAIRDALEVANSFRQQCLQTRCLDYSLTVDAYCRYLLPEPGYRSAIQATYHYLIVDNLEEAVPAQLDLIAALLGSADGACLAFDPSGGHTRGFGADPEQAVDRILPLCAVEQLDTLYGCSKQAASLAAVLYANIRSGTGRTTSAGASPSVIEDRTISPDFRAEMISDLGQSIIDLLEQGLPPERIAVIAPAIDRVLEHTLTRQLVAAGHRLQNLTQRRLLSDEPYTQLMVNIASLARPGAGWPSNTSSLAHCFRTVLGLDPVRSALLARHCFQDGAPSLPDLDGTGLRARLGFSAGDRYDRFRQLVARLQQVDETENLFQQIFSEALAPFVTGPEDIVTSRQVIDTAIKFARAHRNMPKLQEHSLVHGLLQLFTRGAVAAKVFHNQEPEPGAVILTTPLGLFQSGLSFDHQFWVDCSDASWFMKDYRELSNPEVMRRDWDGVWNDRTEQAIIRLGAALRVRGLLYRCRGKVTIVQSDYNGLGYEQQGPLPEIIYESVVASSHGDGSCGFGSLDARRLRDVK